MLHLTFTKYTFATLLHLQTPLKHTFKHIVLAYFILLILGIQTGMHFFHDHSHRLSYESKSKVILSENVSDCLVCSLHLSNELFFITPELFIHVANKAIHYFSTSIDSFYSHTFLSIQDRAPPAYLPLIG